MTTTRAKQKKVFVDVVQFNFNALSDVENFLGHKIWDVFQESDALDGKVKHWIKLPTLDGKVKVFDGDWIIKYPNGDLIVRKPETFELQFERVG